jgi:hypothetical protein
MYFKTTKPKGRHPYLGHLSLAVSVKGLNAVVAKQLFILYDVFNLLKNPNINLRANLTHSLLYQITLGWILILSVSSAVNRCGG